MTTAYNLREIMKGTWEIGEFDCDSLFLLIGQERDFRPLGEPSDMQVLDDAIACCADLVAGKYEECREPGIFPGMPDQTVIRRGCVKVTYREDGIH